MAISTLTNTSHQFSPITEIDDLQPGVTVYVPMTSGFLRGIEGQTTKYVAYVADRYYKRGYEDRLIVAGPSGEVKVRFNEGSGCWMFGHLRVSSTFVPAETISLFSSCLV